MVDLINWVPFKRKVCSLIFIFMTGLLLINSSQSWCAEKFYKGKKVILICNFSPGGSADTWTRLQARHIAKFLPGHPDIIVKNMPGATGLVGYRWLTRVAKPNGLTIGCFGGALASRQATEFEKYPKGTADLRDVPIIAGLQDTNVTFGRKAVFPKGYKSFLNPTQKPIVIANLTRDDSYVRDGASMKILGLKRGKDADFIQVTGYQGGAEAYLALGRGEADIYCTLVSGYRRTPLQEVKAGNWVPLWQGGIVTGSGEVVRDPGVKNIPTFIEVFQELTGKYPSGPYWEYLKWMTATKSAVRFVIAPIGTPEKIISTLSKAWGDMLRSPEYLLDQEKIFGNKEEIMFLSKEARNRIKMILNKPAIVDTVYKEIKGE